MKFGKKASFSLLLGLDLLANGLQIAHINFLYATTIISFCTCILLPGFLISLILRITKISLWENLLFIVGLGIAFLQFGGLLLNILLPLFGIYNPLASQNLVFGFGIYNLLLFIFAWIRTKEFMSQIRFPRCSKVERVLYALPTFFPVLATLGAIVLNNGGSNILTIILLGAIAFYVFILLLLHEKISNNLYAYSIFCVGMAALFTTSLRSWYVAGHDVEREFYVFKLTDTHHIWSIAFYQDAYNACLSITILPTVISHLLSIQDMYVYKVIFQILFATSPVLAFFILNNYAKPIFAFLSSFFFISFPTFFNDMPMLNRQEIGFIFFGLVIYVMLKRNQTRQFYTKFDNQPFTELSLSMRKILFIVFGVSVIVSHYSTNFVLLVLIVFVYVTNLVISLPFTKKFFARLLSKSHIALTNTFINKAFISLPIILLMFAMTYAWNTLYTNSSSHVGSVVLGVANSIFVKSNADAKSSDVSYSIFSSSNVDIKKQLQDYIKSITQSARSIGSNSGNINAFYSISITSKYPSNPIPQEMLAPTPLGDILSSFHFPVFNVQAELRSLSAASMQIFVFIGLLSISFLKNKKSFDLQYLLLCLGAIFLLALEIILPSLSVEYGLLRMFQQFLFLLSLPIVLGLNSVLCFIKQKKRILFTGIITIIFFLDLTGFVSHLTGDYYPQMTLDNAGLYYDAYYVHKSDVLAEIWLSHNDTDHSIVQSNVSGVNQLLAYGDMNALDEIFPPVIRKKAYVYIQVSNSTIVSIDKNIVIFNSPKPFLDDNKNLVYSNGSDNVYK